MLHGLRSAVYPVTDLPAARAWYAELLGAPPRHDDPEYVGFYVGEFELGLIRQGGGFPGPDGVRAYWAVADAAEALARLAARGCEPVQPLTDVGRGIRVASVADPLGNVPSVIQNPQFDPDRADRGTLHEVRT